MSELALRREALGRKNWLFVGSDDGGAVNALCRFDPDGPGPVPESLAVGGAFIDRTPPWLKNFAVQKFGENDKTMLLLGMYVTIALLAMVMFKRGAWKRKAI